MQLHFAESGRAASRVARFSSLRQQVLQLNSLARNKDADEDANGGGEVGLDDQAIAQVADEA